MYALMNENGTVARVTSDDRAEWGGAAHSSLRLLTPAERRRFRIYSVEDSQGEPIADGLPAGEAIEVDHVAGVVRRTQLWRERTIEEQQARQRQQAQTDLSASDAGMSRVLEDVLGALASKGVLLEGDLPAAARTRLATRRALRATIAALPAEPAPR